MFLQHFSKILQFTFFLCISYWIISIIRPYHTNLQICSPEPSKSFPLPSLTDIINYHFPKKVLSFVTYNHISYLTFYLPPILCKMKRSSVQLKLNLSLEKVSVLKLTSYHFQVQKIQHTIKTSVKLLFRL